MNLTQKDFLEKYKISQSEFLATGLKFSDLIDIKRDYDGKFQLYDDAGASLVRMLLRYKDVHSVKYRVKDGEHLVAKIIRKKISNPKRNITLKNYRSEITDLIGIRILHLFQANWISIHSTIQSEFKVISRPEANYRLGDDTAIFKEAKCKIKKHEAGYRSVHYLIETSPTKSPLIAEIQVRTILQEAWSEVDHTVRYPNDSKNELINHYLKLFNRLAGSADEMADFVLILKAQIQLKEVESAELRAKIKESKTIPETEKADLEDSVAKLIPQFYSPGLFELLNSQKAVQLFAPTEGLQKIGESLTAVMNHYKKVGSQ